MRLPAIAIAAAFACGIAVGLHPAAARNASCVFLLASCFITAVMFLSAGFVLARFDHLVPAAVTSLLCWGTLGFLSACVAEQPRHPNHITTLVEDGRIRLQTPLRWHGRLRDEPAKLPWGAGYEIELSGVDFEGELRPIEGGMRVSFTPELDSSPLSELHTGDEVEVAAQAKRPQVFRDEGAFDRRAYLAQQNIDLLATLRAPQLIKRTGSSPLTAATLLAHARAKLRKEVDDLCAGAPQVASVLRAMLLGDRSFVDRAESVNFQKTGAFHVLVVAGLHVGAIAFVLFWLGRRLRLPRVWTMVFTLLLLLGYVVVVEQRPPVLRAALMAAIVVFGGFFFRRLELLNSAALAALLLLIFKPLALQDTSFQLTFLAIGCIAGLAAPWLEKTAQPYVRAVRGWRDVTRDAAHESRAVQFRIDLRAAANWISRRMPRRVGNLAGSAIAGSLSLTFRIWELLVITLTLQVGMLPLMARDFHRVSLSGPLVNLVAVPMIGVVVPLGFLTLASGLMLPATAKLLAKPLVWCTSLLIQVVGWFAHFPRWSYRIPGPPFWLVLSFFVVGVLLACELRLKHSWQKGLLPGLSLAWALSALTIAIYPFSPKWVKGRLELSVLDVGQGDSLFVVSPGGKTLVIDGGGAFSGYPIREESFGIDPGEEAVSPYLWSRGFQKLDVVALTHAHQDHLGGLTAILENFQVGRLWIGREVASPALQRLEELARKRRIPVEHELRGRAFEWDGVTGQFLWPGTAPENVATEAKNDDSLVLRLQYRHTTFMLPGDAERPAERQILAESNEDALRSDVLKVGHHGGKNSTTLEFLAAVQPKVGIISVGEANPYGHPSPELLQRLESAGVRILRTDRDGAVHVLSDGQTIEITCYVACSEARETPSSLQAQTPDRQQGRKKQ